MKRLKWVAGVAALGIAVTSALVSGLGGPGSISSSPAEAQTAVTNNSGRALQVIDGVSGQPVYFGGEPWMIQPGQTFFTHPWHGSSRFVYGDQAYHYIGSVGGSTFQFFIVEDWAASSGAEVPPAVPTAAPAPAATPTPSTPYVQSGGTSYEPNCGLTMIKGRIVNPDGLGRQGVRVQVSAPTWSVVSRESDNNGNYDVVLDGRPKEGVWNVQVWDGSGLSPIVTVETNTTDCQPGGSGRQVAIVDFRKTSY